MKAIVISGYPGSGKTTAAQILAKKLGVRAIGGSDILKEMAIEKGYKPGGEDWWDTEQGIKFSQERDKDPHFDKETDKRMIEKIKKGNIIATTYTVPWISDCDCFKVWLEASEINRAERMSKRDHTTVEEALKAIRIRTRENDALYKELYGIVFGRDLSVFDMVVETDGVSPEQVANAIFNKVKGLK